MKGHVSHTPGMGMSDYSFLLDENDPIYNTYNALTGDDSFPTLISDGVKVSFDSTSLQLHVLIFSVVVCKLCRSRSRQLTHSRG